MVHSLSISLPDPVFALRSVAEEAYKKVRPRNRKYKTDLTASSKVLAMLQEDLPPEHPHVQEISKRLKQIEAKNGEG